MNAKRKEQNKKLRINASLFGETKEEAAKIGNGNVSLGIEIAVAHQKAHNEGSLKDRDGFVKY